MSDEFFGLDRDATPVRFYRPLVKRSIWRRLRDVFVAAWEAGWLAWRMGWP